MRHSRLTHANDCRSGSFLTNAGIRGTIEMKLNNNKRLSVSHEFRPSVLKTQFPKMCDHKMQHQHHPLVGEVPPR